VSQVTVAGAERGGWLLDPHPQLLATIAQQAQAVVSDRAVWVHFVVTGVTSAKSKVVHQNRLARRDKIRKSGYSPP
jgi:hypothetical protein